MTPPLLRQNPPILAESAQPSAPDMARLFAVLAGMNAKMDGNAQQMKIDMKEDMEKMRGEMQQIGRGLQAGIMALACDETRTEGEKMAPPRAGTNELGGSATAVRPAVGAGTDQIIWETCWGRLVEVTEEVTVTQWRN